MNSAVCFDELDEGKSSPFELPGNASNHPVQIPSFLEEQTHRRKTDEDCPPLLSLCSLEYLVYSATSVSFVLYGFVRLSFVSKGHFSGLRDFLEPPNSWLRELFGSVGYDGRMDRQWWPYVRNYALHVTACTGIGVVGRYIRSLTFTVDIENADTTTRSKSKVLGRPCPRWLCRSIQSGYYFLCGVMFVLFLHGTRAVVPFLIVVVNYIIFTRLQRRTPYLVYMTILWTTHFVIMYVTELTDGYAAVLKFVQEHLLPESLQSVLDSGQVVRWHVIFHMYTLRLIAFNYDLWEASHRAASVRTRAMDKHASSCIECGLLREKQCSTQGTPAEGRLDSNNQEVHGVAVPASGESHHVNERGSGGLLALSHAVGSSVPVESMWCYKLRTEYSRDTSEYDFLTYLAYMLYPPLYFSGPMMSYNAFVSYLRTPSAGMPPRCMLLYAMRIAAIGICNYVMLHFAFVHSFSSRAHFILLMKPSDQAYLMFFYLAALWLKFSFIWKTARLLSLVDGVEPPEDMRRCYANTFSIRDFWRDWHASFNQWIVRYMYIPMGGSRTKMFSIFPIFFFIAVWHDRALHLLKWALIIAVVFVLEVVVSHNFARVVRIVTQPTGCNRISDSPVQGSAMGMGCRLGQCIRSHLSPAQRRFGYRVVCSIGGTLTVFVLTVSNLIGFSVQHVETGPQKSSKTDANIVLTLCNASAGFWLGTLVFLYTIAACGFYKRQIEAQQAHIMKRKLNLSE